MPEQQTAGRPNDQKPDQWQHDLNPNPMAGQNHGEQGSSSVNNSIPADQMKDLHRQLENYTDAELKQIMVIRTGSRLEQGATYIDLADPERKEFTAMGDMEANPNHYYVAKTEVDYQLWNQLTGVQNPERTGEGNG